LSLRRISRWCSLQRRNTQKEPAARTGWPEARPIVTSDPLLALDLGQGEQKIGEVAPTTAGLLPMLGGRVKPGLLSPDCLHLSRRANSIFGRNLWNNLMQPWSHKQVDYREDTPVLCPTKEHPFLSTQINS